MKFKKYRSGMLVAGVISMVVMSCISCSKDEEMTPPPPTTEQTLLSIDFSAVGDGGILEDGKTFKDPLNRTLEVSTLRFYVSNISLVKGGTEIPIKDFELITLVDEQAIDPEAMIQEILVPVESGTYDGLKLSIGLDPETNSSDPGQFPSEHPLSSGQNMHWGAWSKYVFIKIEGKADTTGGNDLSYIFGYHTGFDTCYREVTFNSPFTVKSGATLHTNINLEFNDIFFGNDTLDIAKEKGWHGDMETVDRAIRISDNFRDALKFTYTVE